MVNRLATHLLGIVFIAVPFFTQAQKNNLTYLKDSAVSLLQMDTLSDSNRLKVLSTICDNTTNPDEQLKYALQLIDEAEKQESAKFLFLGYIRLGGTYKLKGNLTEALKSYLKAASIASENADPVYEADAYTNVATVYTSNEDYDKSLGYYQKALELYTNKIDSQRLAITYINYSYATYKAGLYDSAISLSKKAIYFSQFSKYDLIGAYAQSNMALTLAKTGEFEEAENKLTMAMEVMDENNDQYALSDCLVEIGGVYLEEGQLQTSIDKLLKGYKIAVENGLKQQIQNGAKFLSKAYEQKGDLSKALDYQSKYYTYRDSLTNADLIRKLADQRTEFEVGQKQVELDLVTAEKKTQQIILYATAGGAILVIALLGLVYKNYRDKNKINKILEDQKTQLEELNHTKDKFFSIVSHDLRGPVVALSGISRLIQYSIEDDDKEGLIEVSEHIDKTVNHLSGLLDNLLNWAMQQQGHFPNVPEKLDVKAITTEIVGIFENMADGKNIALTSSIEDDIFLWSDKNMTMTILRNLVNNALKFTSEKGEVTITAKKVGDMAAISVKDTGVGIPEEKLERLFKMEGKLSEFGTAGEKGLGLGLQLVYEFVEMNNGTIEVESEEGKGTKFTVYLPLFVPENVEVN